jgi:enamidase
VAGVKALAIAAQRSFARARPSGVKVIAGAPLLAEGMTFADFQELADGGVSMIGEIGIGPVRDTGTAAQMVSWAREAGLRSLTHTGGPSTPISRQMTAEDVLEIDPDVIGHINGGHTAPSSREIRCLCERCNRAIEIVHNGNEFAALLALRIARDRKQLDRVTPTVGARGEA